jgi:hypothetical protein
MTAHTFYTRCSFLIKFLAPVPIGSRYRPVPDDLKDWCQAKGIDRFVTIEGPVFNEAYRVSDKFRARRERKTRLKSEEKDTILN